MEGIKRVSGRKRDRTRKGMIRGRVIEEKRREKTTEKHRKLEGGREGRKDRGIDRQRVREEISREWMTRASDSY